MLPRSAGEGVRSSPAVPVEVLKALGSPAAISGLGLEQGRSVGGCARWCFNCLCFLPFKLIFVENALSQFSPNQVCFAHGSNCSGISVVFMLSHEFINLLSPVEEEWRCGWL